MKISRFTAFADNEDPRVTRLGNPGYLGDVFPLSRVIALYFGMQAQPPVQRISRRRFAVPIEIVDYDSRWPALYDQHADRIKAALGASLISIAHYGSTSVPGCPAKAIIDIDVVVGDVHNEDGYIPQLEATGYRFLLREPGWHEHRFLVHDREDMYPANIHVWGSDREEADRHQLFRRRLINNPRDLEAYAVVKRQAALDSTASGEKMDQYTERKTQVIKDILARAPGS